MQRRMLLGVDIGTTNMKAVAYSLEGEPLAPSGRPTPTRSVRPRCDEHDPHALWRAVTEAIREVMQANPDMVCEGLAIASIGEAGVLLDDKGAPLGTIIAWYDERTVPQARWWADNVGEKDVYRVTGLPLGHTFSVNKLMWWRDEHPSVFRRAFRWLCVSDYVVYCLTGQQCMGYSLASRTMGLDLERRCWSEELLTHAELSLDLFPELMPEGSVAGHVTAEASRETGLPQGLPVMVAGHDHVCGALAMGVFEPGVVLDSTGTTEAELVALTSVTDHLVAGDLAFCLGCHVVPDQYYAIGAILGAGSMIAWVGNLLWPDSDLNRQACIKALTDAAAESKPGARGLYWLPHMAGAGSPERNPTARGVLVGLGLEHSRADLARAAIEGLALELGVLWESLESFTGQGIYRVVSVGGGSRNDLWTHIKTDVTGRSLALPEHSEATCLGAALLAGMGVGVFDSAVDAHTRTRRAAKLVEPNPVQQVLYQELYERVAQHLRPASMSLSHKMSANSL